MTYYSTMERLRYYSANIMDEDNDYKNETLILQYIKYP